MGVKKGAMCLLTQGSGKLLVAFLDLGHNEYFSLKNSSFKKHSFLLNCSCSSLLHWSCNRNSPGRVTSWAVAVLQRFSCNSLFTWCETPRVLPCSTRLLAVLRVVACKHSCFNAREMLPNTTKIVPQVCGECKYKAVVTEIHTKTDFWVSWLLPYLPLVFCLLWTREFTCGLLLFMACITRWFLCPCPVCTS